MDNSIAIPSMLDLTKELIDIIVNIAKGSSVTYWRIKPFILYGIYFILVSFYMIYIFIYQKKTIRQYIVRAALLMLLPFVDIAPFYIYYKWLCNTESQNDLKMTYHVDGFLELNHTGGCNIECAGYYLQELRFKFIEIMVRRGNQNTLTPQKGYYKLFISNKDDPACGSYFRLVNQHGKLNAKEGYCYAAVYINQPTSTFSHEIVSDRYVSVIDILNFFDIRQAQSIIKNINDGRIVSFFVCYYHFGPSKLLREMTFINNKYYFCSESSEKLLLMFHESLVLFNNK